MAWVEWDWSWFWPCWGLHFSITPWPCHNPALHSPHESPKATLHTQTSSTTALMLSETWSNFTNFTPQPCRTKVISLVWVFGNKTVVTHAVPMCFSLTVAPPCKFGGGKAAKFVDTLIYPYTPQKLTCHLANRSPKEGIIIFRFHVLYASGVYIWSGLIQTPPSQALSSPELGNIGATNGILGSELWPNTKLSIRSWFHKIQQGFSWGSLLEDIWQRWIFKLTDGQTLRSLKISSMFLHLSNVQPAATKATHFSKSQGSLSRGDDIRRGTWKCLARCKHQGIIPGRWIWCLFVPPVVEISEAIL